MLPFDDEAFPYCMQVAQHRLNDPSKEDWEEGHRHDIHAMVLLADDDEDRLWRQKDDLCAEIKAHSKVCTVEYGRVMWNWRNSPQGYPVEHFGYANSRSQPLFFQGDIERESIEGDGTNLIVASAQNTRAEGKQYVP
jgi:hypothetical protein